MDFRILWLCNRVRMLKPLEVLQLYPEHDYTLCGAYDSRIAAACDRPFVVFQGKAWSRTEFRQALLATARVLTAPRGYRR